MQELANAATPITRELLGHHAKWALGNFYDRVQLQSSPLIGLLCRDYVGEPAATCLRRILRESIEALRPEPFIPFDDPAWIGFRLLWTRYVHRRSAEAVCSELGLGRTSYYRYHQQAMDALASVLWERYQASRTLGTAGQIGKAALCGQDAIREAVRLARLSPRQPVDMSDLLLGVDHVIRPLAEQQGTVLQIHVSEKLPPTSGDPAMLRQALLSLLMQALDYVPGKTLKLEVHLDGMETVWRLSGWNTPSAEIDLQSDGINLACELVKAYGGRLAVEGEAEAPAIVFSLPVARAETVLAIDDDDDTLRLYCAWLQTYHYQSRVARSREELDAILAEETPDLILLDVLMPQWDGWSVLQYVKTLLQTASVPVIVCSVLSQPRLALALGAVAVLNKPITEDQLLSAVREVLASANNQA